MNRAAHRVSQTTPRRPTTGVNQIIRGVHYSQQWRWGKACTKSRGIVFWRVLGYSF